MGETNRSPSYLECMGMVCASSKGKALAEPNTVQSSDTYTVLNRQS
jgi:hypothetical protein